MKLSDIFSIQTESGNTEQIREFVLRYASAIPNTKTDVDDIGNVTITKGTGEGPCVVAHMDTVHDIINAELRVMSIDGKLIAIRPDTGEQVGIGGDDKCGVYAALLLMQYAHDGMAVLTVDEETGCVGASMYDIERIKHCSFLMQADRRGGHDLIVNACGEPLCSKEFLRAIKPIAAEYGFAPASGTVTDVQCFVQERKVGLSAFNVSAGYIRPHSSTEAVVIEDMFRAIRFMRAAWDRLGGQQWPFTPKPRRWSPPKRKASDELDWWKGKWHKWNEKDWKPRGTWGPDCPF